MVTWRFFLGHVYQKQPRPIDPYRTPTPLRGETVGFYSFLSVESSSHWVILKIVPKYLTLVKKSERVRRPSQRSNVLLKIIRLIYLAYMCVACANHVMHSSNVLDQILVRRLWWY